MDMRSVIVSFGQSLTIDRRSPGVWIDGIFIEGTLTSVVTTASVQPIGRDAQLLPEGVLANDAKSVWATMLLRTADDPDSNGPDRFTYGGSDYEVVSVDDWATGPQGDYSKAIAKRVREQL